MDGTLDSIERAFRDPDEWSNDGTELSMDLYMAQFEVWKVDPREIVIPSAIQRGPSQDCIDAQECCIAIFDDFDEREIKKVTASVRNAWAVGKAIRARIDSGTKE